MREKLLNLMKEEGLTSSRLAELLGIQPSGISHILKGRNNPSLDFIQKILRRFPRINPDWLILGEGEMYRGNVESVPNAQAATPAASENRDADASSHDNAVSSQIGGSSNNLEENAKIKTDTSATRTTETQQPQMSIFDTHPMRGRVKRVIVLFDDHTFESYEAK